MPVAVQQLSNSDGEQSATNSAERFSPLWTFVAFGSPAASWSWSESSSFTNGWFERSFWTVVADGTGNATIHLAVQRSLPVFVGENHKRLVLLLACRNEGLAFEVF